MTARPGLERPVVLVAAADDDWHRAVEALSAGATDCLRLPVDDAELRARIGAALIGRHARLAERHALGEAIHGDSLQVLAALTMRLQLVQRRAEQSGMRLDASTTAELSDIKGEEMSIGFGGARIRNYVLQPYQQVKDDRTQHEEGNVAAVLDGALDPFMEAWLRDQRAADATS